MLGELRLHRVAHEGSDGRARARQNADDRADDGAADHGPLDRPDFLEGRHLRVDLAAGNAVLRGEALLLRVGLLEDLGDGEQTDQHRDHVDTGQQVAAAERQALHRVHLILTDAGQQQADQTGDDAVEDVVAVQARQDRQTHERHGEQVARAELERGLRQRLRQQEHRDGGEQAADGGSQQRHAQRLARFAALRHGIAVKCRRRGRGDARNLEQNRGDRAARDGRAIDRNEEDDGRNRLHRVGEGQAEGNRHRRGNARQRAEDRTEDDGDADHQEHARIKYCGCAGGQKLSHTHNAVASLKDVLDRSHDGFEPQRKVAQEADRAARQVDAEHAAENDVEHQRDAHRRNQQADDVLFAQQQTVEEEDEQRGHDEADSLQNEGGGDHDHDAQEQLALEEAGDAPHKSAQREIRIALVLLDDLDDVYDQADLKQNDDCLWPNVRLERIGVIRHFGGNRRFQHMGEKRVAKEDEEQNVDNQFKHSAVTPYPPQKGFFCLIPS